MTVRDVKKDPENLTLTLTADFEAPAARVWRIWSEPALLGRWWGPPGWPATFVHYEFQAGGRAHYFMQGPEGQRHHGGWNFTALQPKQSLAFDDYFADEHGAPTTSLPGASMVMALTEADGVTTMTLTSSFASLQDLEQLAAMGMVEGITQAAGQIDAILEELARAA